MVDNVDSMLENLYPGVDPRLRTKRQGNPIEQGLAVARGELSEPEVAGLVASAGVSKEFNDLPIKSKLLVVDGLSGLWKINRIGSDVERKDKENVGSLEEMKRVVNEDSGQIERQYHGSTLGWLPHSVRPLVQAVSEKDSEKQKNLKNGVLGIPHDYIRKLTSVGYDYRERRSNISKASDRERVDAYLTGDRESDLGTMRNLLFQRVASVVAAIKPVAEGAK